MRTEKNRMMQLWIDAVYKQYTKNLASEKKHGWISREHMDWVVEQFNMNSMTLKEISDLWFQIDYYFEPLTDRTGEYDADAVYFAMDIESAWKEVCNYVGREKRNAQ